MSWAKIDDRANEHEKQLAAGPRACWLWACGLMYCNRQTKKTGRIPKAVVHGGMLFLGTGKKDAEKLVEVGLWYERDEHYEVHEYHGWNPELSEKRAEAGRAGGRASGEARREANPKQLASDVEANEPSNPEASEEASGIHAHSRARTHAQTRAGSTPPHSTPGEHPFFPLRPRDRLAESLTSKSPKNRPDVQGLFAEFCETYGFTGAKLGVGLYNLDPETLAECIDARGMADCRLVLKHSPNDGMVSGRDDENKNPHHTIKYIFGNQDAFNRILRAARAAEAQAPGSVAEQMRKAAEAQP